MKCFRHKGEHAIFRSEWMLYSFSSLACKPNPSCLWLNETWIWQKAERMDPAFVPPLLSHMHKTFPLESNCETPTQPVHVYLDCSGKRTKCANLPQKMQSRLPNTAQLLRKKKFHFATESSQWTNKEPGTFVSVTTSPWGPSQVDYSPQ